MTQGIKGTVTHGYGGYCRGCRCDACYAGMRAYKRKHPPKSTEASKRSKAKNYAKRLAASPDPKVRWPTQYDECPNCHGRKSRVSKLCRNCYNSMASATRSNAPRRGMRMPNRKMVTGGA